jgi:hypothetical protein
MTLIPVRGLLAATLFVSASVASAQTATPAATRPATPTATPTAAPTAAPTATRRLDPADANAEVPALVHRSAFTSYRAAGEIEVGSWREANDTVARIGGWRAYAREAAQPDAPAGPDPAAVSTPATDPAMRSSPRPAPAPAGGHGGHPGHGKQ